MSDPPVTIPLSQKLIAWLIEHHQCSRVTPGADEETLSHVYGRKTARLLASGGDDPHIRIKDASERYCEKRHEVRHAKTGRPVFDAVHERECVSMSEGSKARAGVLFKHLARKAGVNCPLSEHEQNLLTEMCERQTWCGKIGTEFYDEITPHANVKQLIDDVPSGGLEIVPIDFDSDVITFPLLGGELYPFVDTKPVPRGRRIEGASIDTPTLALGRGRQHRDHGFQHRGYGQPDRHCGPDHRSKAGVGSADHDQRLRDFGMGASH